MHIAVALVTEARGIPIVENSGGQLNASEAERVLFRPICVFIVGPGLFRYR